MAQTSDADICTFAADQARIIVSKDEDFLGLVLRPGVTVQFVWIRMPNCTNAALLAAIDRALARTISLLEAGHQVVEIR